MALARQRNQNESPRSYNAIGRWCESSFSASIATAIPEDDKRLDQLEQEFGDDLGEDRVFLAEHAWEELETWVLAGLDLPHGWRWPDVRAEVQVKERYFEPLAAERGVADRPGGGRKPLAEEAAGRFEAIRRKCGEDFDVLVNRVQEAVAAVPD